MVQFLDNFLGTTPSDSSPSDDYPTEKLRGFPWGKFFGGHSWELFGWELIGIIQVEFLWQSCQGIVIRNGIVQSYPVTYTVMRYKTELNKQDSTHFSSSVINFYVNCSFCEIDFLKPKNLNL